MIRNTVEGVMAKGEDGDPAFSSPLELMLYACSKIYTAGVKFRLGLYDKGVLKSKSLPCRVVSVGNITSGGTGKTPVVHYVSGLLKGLGCEVAVISRGYGGGAEHNGGIVSDGAVIAMGPGESGEEPQLLASKLKGIPVLVGRNRYESGRLAIRRFGSSILVLDDGFQHISLRRDLNLLLLDSARPFGNGYCIPRGVLREPVDQVKRASAFVITRCDYKEGIARTFAAAEGYARGRPVFRCKHVPEGLFVAGSGAPVDMGALEGQRLFVFSGIAQNNDFHAAIAGLGGRVAGSFEFPDHHQYSDGDLRSIWETAGGLKAAAIVTTEKDYFNIPYKVPSDPRLLVLTVAVSFGDDKERFERYLRRELKVDDLVKSRIW